MLLNITRKGGIQVQGAKTIAESIEYHGHNGEWK